MFRRAEPETFAAVASRLNSLTPVAVFDVPPHSVTKPFLERVRRRPVQLAADLCRVDGIPSIVARPVWHERLQPVMALCRWSELVERIAHEIDHVDVGAFAATADVVFLAGAALLQHEQNA